MRWLGVDVGGANIKVSDAGGFARSLPFELWRYGDELASTLRKALASAPKWDALAATMTGELADCYETKSAGVRHITGALAAVAGPRPLAIYGVDGEFHTAVETLDDPLMAAASNWHALARFAAKWLPDRTGVVIDVGSTTSDFIPVVDGQVATASKTDTGRLQAGELVYTGVGRTPVCALVGSLPYHGSDCPVAAELFATTADVYRLLGLTNTPDSIAADGRPFTRRHCVDRLARQVCADRDTFSESDARAAAEWVHERQLELLEGGLSRVCQSLAADRCAAIVSGSGEFLAKRLAIRNTRIESVLALSDIVGEEQSHSAAATAVAWLAAKECPDGAL